MAWDCYDNHENENFTFVGASAYFTTGDYVDESILAVVTLDSAPSPDYPGSTRYALTVSCPVDNKDNRDGQFNVDITLSASGAGGVPHIPGDHIIPSQFGGIIIVEEYPESWNRDPIIIQVLPKAGFSLVTLYEVNLDVDLWLENNSKLVVKFYTWGDDFEAENVVWSGPAPDNVVLLDDIPHPQGKAVKKVRLDLTTDDTGNVISTIASFTVCKVDLETRFSKIPLEWALASPAEKVALEIEFAQIPLYWALAPY